MGFSFESNTCQLESSIKTLAIQQGPVQILNSEQGAEWPAEERDKSNAWKILGPIQFLYLNITVYKITINGITTGLQSTRGREQHK